MAKYKIRSHHSYEDDGITIKSIYQDIEDTESKLGIPTDSSNRHYQEYLENLKNDMSNVTCTDCGDGVPNDSMWQYLDNAEQLIHNKYHSDPSLHDKITALREHKYVRAMKAEFPYESMTDAGPIIDSTSKEIKQKYNLPPRI